MDKQEIGRLIKNRRVELKITQQGISDMTGISTPIISALENGTSNISLNNLSEILDVLGLDMKIDIKEK